jgi:hypothetical protein
MKTWTLVLNPIALAGLLACGGKTDGTPAATTLDTESALAMTAPFLNEQNNQTGEMDDSGPVPAFEAAGFADPEHPSCVTLGERTPSAVTWAYNNCTGPHGWIWNGQVVMTWTRNADGTVLVKHDHKNLVGSKDGKSWTINGVRQNLGNPTTRIVQITAEPGFTKAFSDGTKSTVFTYTLNLTADWSEVGRRKLFGAWALTPVTGDAFSAAVAQSTPLVWDRSANCCYPVSGTLVATRGTQSTRIVHSLPCGTVTLNGETKLLPACNR